ncbi:MAG TPA: hypothetical protein VFE62_16330 [Gemmataceae bacterium]|nr:hypothetical protein [Gemmataceae bacterium]
MSTSMQPTISPNLMADLRAAAANAAKGARHPEDARAACEEMDRIREEIRQKHGVLEIGVAAIRELRDS